MDLPQLDGVTHRTVPARGLRFHVAEAGAGDPIVLVHGWPQHWWMWRHVVPLLAPHARLVMIDLRGFGWSDAPPGAYDKQTLADDLLAVLDALGLERVRLDRPRLGRLERLPGLPGGARALRGLPRPRRAAPRRPAERAPAARGLALRLPGGDRLPAARPAAGRRTRASSSA